MISIVIIGKDEPALAETLLAIRREVAQLDEQAEIIVVDASEGRLDDIRGTFSREVNWLQFSRPAGVRISIPHQRNTGVLAARGEIIVFTDAGCIPEDNWLQQLSAPLSAGEYMTHGLTLGVLGGMKLHDRVALERVQERYLPECSTINTAFRRELFDAVGGFDETFAYGSDTDFSWRVINAGYRIRSVPLAVVRHDWGTTKRQLRRSFLYGKARTRLYRKHPSRLRSILRRDPMVVVYPLFILGLPITLIFPFYPALLLIPAWRNRQDGSLQVVVDHLLFGVGVLSELLRK